MSACLILLSDFGHHFDGFPETIREPLDMVCKISSKIKPMKKVKFDTNKLKKTLKRIKNKKAAGPSGLKPEFYKVLADSEVCVDIMAKCYDKELYTREKPKSWKISSTKMSIYSA